MDIAKMGINKITEHPQNFRTVTKSQFKALKRSIKQYGLIDPLVVNEKGLLLSGHQRLKVLRQRGVKTVDVLVVKDGELSEFNKVNEKSLKEIGVKFKKNELTINWKKLELKKSKVKVKSATSNKSASTTVSAYKLVKDSRISWDMYNRSFHKVIDKSFWYNFLEWLNENKEI